MPRTLVRAGILVALLAPSLAFAAFDDVSLTTGTAFTVGSTELDVYTSSAVIQSVTVNPTNMTLTLAPGSSVTVLAPNKAGISQSGGDSYITVNECDNNASQIGFSYPAGAGSAVTITLTLSGTTCSGGSGGGGGGGGGSVSSTPAAPATPATPTVAPATPATPAVPATPAAPVPGLTEGQVQSILTLLASFNADQSVIGKVNASLHVATTANVSTPGASVFTRDFQVGATGSDAHALQVFLNTHGYIVVASGAGSPGNETNKFGALTKAALIKFQKASGITPAAGYFGPKTRAYIAAH